MANSNESCCVYGCPSVRKKTQRISYHGFPKEGEKIGIVDDFGESQICERRKLWKAKLQMWQNVSKSTRVCSLHFVDGDYGTSGWSSRKRLRLTAVPSKNLPSTNQLSGMRNYSTCVKEKPEEQLSAEETPLRDNVAAEEFTVLETDKVNETKETCSVGIQVNYHDLMCCKNIETQVDTIRDESTVTDSAPSEKQPNCLMALHLFAVLQSLLFFY